MSEICRAITFINYHIPYREHDDSHYRYMTFGFFDGMDTKALTVDYARDGLRSLWHYILDRTKQSNGLYSYQNVFCFSDDSWNNCQDREFWNPETDKRYPLTFISFLQLGDYSTGSEEIQKRCVEYRDVISEALKNDGKVYIYSTIDKNDYVICIKSTDYKKAVETIKKVHRVQNTIYSYTVFSVLSDVLRELDSPIYQGLFDQILPSISLKGVVNSFDPSGNITVDKRYYDFCINLVSCLYDLSKDEIMKLQKKNEALDMITDKTEEEDPFDFKIYDILGDDDFRLIVRNVSLGRLMKQFASNGMLSYEGNFFRFYLFSSSLILNTMTRIDDSAIGENDKKTALEEMKKKFQSPKCELLERDMDRIKEVIFNRDSCVGEKMITCCYAIWQLIQSMKALETAPTKQYDFLSVYYPLKSLVQILEQKMASGREGQMSFLAENEEIFEFIHKISMTIDGTLRTDVQFFQIRDFNAIVHYAPAKIRAFYTLWTQKMKEYYNLFTDGETNKYAFVLSPGMYSGTSIRQLFTKYDEKHRLMLISVPERHLYAPKWLAIMLAHETSHFVGWKIRNRKYRENIWLDCCMKVFFLEIRKYVLAMCSQDYKKVVIDYCRTNHRFEDVISVHIIEKEKELVAHEPLWPHQFHSENSFATITRAFEDMGTKFLEKACGEEVERISNSLSSGLDLKKKPYAEASRESKKIRNFVDELKKNMERFYDVFMVYCLPDLLELFRYISSEIYADLNAILTLDLMPWDYLSSFFSCELDRDYLAIYNQDLDMLLPYRITLSIKTINDAMRGTDNKKWLECNEQAFYEAWSSDVFDTLPQKFAFGSKEADLAIKCRHILNSVVEYRNNIQEYRGIYQPEEFKFSLKETNLFVDRDIWDNLLQYLKKCVDDYIFTLMEDGNIWEKKRELVSTYSKLAGESANHMMQEMESFLHHVESVNL